MVSPPDWFSKPVLAAPGLLLPFLRVPSLPLVEESYEVFSREVCFCSLSNEFPTLLGGVLSRTAAIDLRHPEMANLGKPRDAKPRVLGKDPKIAESQTG